MGEYRNENWVKILSDSYKRAILLRKNGKKWGDIEIKIELKFCLIHIKELFYWEKMVKNGGIKKWKLGQTLSRDWIAPGRCILHY